MQPKTQNINYEEYQEVSDLKMWVQWLLTTEIVEKMSKRE